MRDVQLTVLLIEDNPGDARLIQEALSELTAMSLDLVMTDRLSHGVERLAGGDVDLVLLDLSLPDSDWQQTLKAVHRRCPLVPIIVLTGIEDELVANQAVEEGAQDFLIKGEVDARSLERAIRYAIQRHRTVSALRAMSMTDELTGLYNQRGFMALAEQQLALANRTGQSLALFFIDLDGLKWVNDNVGHASGNELIAAAATVLNESFRTTDLIARVGGDEFAVLAIDASTTGGHMLLARIRTHIAHHNAESNAPCALSMSIGMSTFDPKTPRSLQELLAEADQLMYEAKNSKKRRRGQRPTTEGDIQGVGG